MVLARAKEIKIDEVDVAERGTAQCEMKAAW